MKIVISISETTYAATCKGCMLPPDVKDVVEAIKNGAPLPKHHADLIERRCGNKACNGCEHSDICDTYNAPTIIEADKE